MVARDFSVLDGLDAATDISVTAVYQELDERYPGSKFVLTVRALESWLASVEGHFAARDQRKYEGASAAGLIREMTYGRRDFDRASFAITHATHTLDVRQYFRGRPDDLLVMDITAGQGWEVLCTFLGLAVPGSAFPHLHKRQGPAVEAKPAAAMAS